MKFTIIHGLHPGCGHRKIVAAGRLQTQAAGGAGLFTTVARSEAATVKIPAEEQYTIVLRQCHGKHTSKRSGAKKPAPAQAKHCHNQCHQRESQKIQHNSSPLAALVLAHVSIEHFLAEDVLRTHRNARTPKAETWSNRRTGLATQ
jgi:hypothetical protein